MSAAPFRMMFLVGALILGGCSDGRKTDAGPEMTIKVDLPVTPKADGPVKPDMSKDMLSPDSPPPVPDITNYFDWGTLPTTELVVDKMFLPLTSTDTQKYGVDLDGNSTVDNALGSTLTTLVSMGLEVDPQQSLSHNINQGKLLTLLRVLASDFVTAPQALLKVWKGKEQACCTTVGDMVACASEAKATCFAGSHTFEPDPATSSPSIAPGTISSSALQFGPGYMKLTMTLLGYSSITVGLKKAQVKGTLTTAPVGITAGVLAGGIPKADVDNVVIPGLADEVNQWMNDPNTDPGLVYALGMLFDTNSDGTITTAEVAGNGMVTSFLAGDVDVDKDGVPELSVGVGFTAVGATLQNAN